jgi:hypothetical protein
MIADQLVTDERQQHFLTNWSRPRSTPCDLRGETDTKRALDRPGSRSAARDARTARSTVDLGRECRVLSPDSASAGIWLPPALLRQPKPRLDHGTTRRVAPGGGAARNFAGPPLAPQGRFASFGSLATLDPRASAAPGRTHQGRSLRPALLLRAAPPTSLLEHGRQQRTIQGVSPSTMDDLRPIGRRRTPGALSDQLVASKIHSRRPKGRNGHRASPRPAWEPFPCPGCPNCPVHSGGRSRNGVPPSPWLLLNGGAARTVWGRLWPALGS